MESAACVSTEEWMISVSYVDDLLVFGNREEDVTNLQDPLRKYLSKKALGKTNIIPWNRNALGKTCSKFVLKKVDKQAVRIQEHGGV